MPLDFTASVRSNTDLGQRNFLLEFSAPEAVLTMAPAQFFMIGIPGAETILRRPYSVCGLPGTFDDRARDTVQVLYKVVGRGTGLLSSLGSGATISVLGPLGHGFTRPATSSTRPVFVAGGIGSAPFPALTAALAGRYRRPTMLYGARSAGELPLHDWFGERCDLQTTTDDGSLGRRGLVTEPLAELLAGAPSGALQVYACGPEPMLRAVSRLAIERSVPCEVSLEAHMACGFGVCLGCVVPTRNGASETGYERVCVEGPVMPAERLAW